MIGNLRRDVALAALVTLAIIAIVSFAPAPGASLLSGETHDFGHVVVFAVLGLVLARTLRRVPVQAPGWPLVAIATLAAGLGLGTLTEFVQQYLGGVVSLGDIARDTFGAALGCCAAIALEPPRARRACLLLWTVVAAGLLAASLPLANVLLDYRARAAMFPVLLDPDAPRGLAFARGFGRTVTLETLPRQWQSPGGTHGEHALLVRVDSGNWPGLTLSEPAPDWRGWRLLVLDLVNPGDAPLSLVLRVNDRAHDNGYEDRYNAGFELAPRTRRRVEFPLAEIESAPRTRRLALDQVAKLIVFHDGALPGGRFYVRTVTLVR